ncbi:MAG: prepilin-type N-terminal cleavage/methylation domain-containing protein [Planctomycetaceae bacterium]|nr:hypothetical protein [Planctomycetota bacterium]NUO16406.1 prepilin-type N-terminal cleavage/methylation domain-containing protein [Planctomycetaceae bacterium]
MERSRGAAMTRSDKGFTLIELMIVIGIVAVLVAVLAVAILPWIQKAKPRATKALLQNVGNALAGEKVTPNETSFRKDAGALAATLSNDDKMKSSQILVFYLCPTKEVWDQAPAYKGKSYSPKQDPQQFKDSMRGDAGKLQYFVDAWDRPVWFRIEKSGAFLISSAGDDGQWDTDDDLIFDSRNNSVRERAEILGK